MQAFSANSSPLIELMTNFLQFAHETWVQKQNAIELDSFLGITHKWSSLEERILAHGPEFISTVMLQHLFFQESVTRSISLQFPRLSNQEAIPNFKFRNAYLNNQEFKIESFDFGALFTKIGDVDKVLQLIRALLLEKKVILIKQDVSDVAILMQTLVTLLSPFKWNYPLITDLPPSLIEALESPQPFLIAIQRRIWDSQCKVQMMDNI